MADDQVKRREFLKLTGKATLLAAFMGGGEYLLSKNIYSPYRPPAKNVSARKGVPPQIAVPDLASVRSTAYRQATRTAVGLVGGIGRFVANGDTVAIKPNIGWDRTPAQGANTNPELVQAMVELCFEAGAGKVIVTDMSCNDPRRCFLRSGISDALKNSGAELILPEERHFVKADLKGEILGTWPVLRFFLEADKLINMPVVKTHGMSRVTIGMKNWYGVLGGARNRLHQQIDTSIADLADFFRPTLIIADATRVMVRNGPVGGNLSDVEIRNTVIASTDQVAADSFGCRFLGVNPAELGYVNLAEKRGLGKSTGYSLVEKELT
jgi:uncharacterized protein (DUF362 family)